jgi:RNA polymerase sigma factor (sigma-70 family)
VEKDNSIFLSVLASHKGIIYKVAGSYTHTLEDREDLVQEIIFQLWKSFEKYDQHYKWSTWIYRISLNVSITFYRKESRKKTYSHPLTTSIIETIPEESDDDQTGNIGLLRKFISEMKELDRALLILYLDENSYREMAEILGLSESNVATKIGRIKERLKERFASVNMPDAEKKAG